MQYSKLGSSGLNVSRVCLGSMTWGTQNNQADADAQIAYALDQGVNFIDTAELYSIPPNAESYGKTETIIGNWLSRHPAKRGDIVIASKIAGPGLAHIRNGGPITRKAVVESIDASLRRLQTDYLDLYQLHWPNRKSPHFGKHQPDAFNFTDANAEQETADMLDILQGLNECIIAGKVRHWGLSDDTPWGISTYLRLSDQYQLPRPVSIQNEFSLLHTKDWPYLIEQCVMENIAYLPWSPLAGGMLSGKYLNGARPEGSRWLLNQRHGLFRDNAASNEAIKAYCDIANANNMAPAQLALKWCDQINGVTSTIIGATAVTQLKEDIDAFSLDYPETLADRVSGALAKYPMPF